MDLRVSERLVSRNYSGEQSTQCFPLDSLLICGHMHRYTQVLTTHTNCQFYTSKGKKNGWMLLGVTLQSVLKAGVRKAFKLGDSLKANMGGHWDREENVENEASLGYVS